MEALMTPIPSVLIVGYGTVGRNLNQLFLDADIEDQYTYPPRMAPSHTKHWTVAFICVPTPSLPDGSADTHIVEEVIERWADYCDVLCLKSTVPPGFTQRYIDAGYAIVMSPEFYGATQHSLHIDYNFVILGGETEATDTVAELYKEWKPASYRIHTTDATTAELVKYAENAFLATKVTFFNEWAHIVRTFGSNVNEWRELLLLDPRIGRSHTFSYAAHPYYDSHCLNKDIPAIIQACENAADPYIPILLRAVRSLNTFWKNGGDNE
jgi:UDPglucose 6-dehydrogenase